MGQTSALHAPWRERAELLSPHVRAHTHTKTTCPRSSGREHLRQRACSETSQLQKKKKKQEGKSLATKSRKSPGVPLPTGRDPGRFDRGEEAGGGLQVSRPQKIPEQNSVRALTPAEAMPRAQASSIDREEPQVLCRRCVTAARSCAPRNRNHRAAKLHVNSKLLISS